MLPERRKKTIHHIFNTLPISWHHGNILFMCMLLSCLSHYNRIFLLDRFRRAMLRPTIHIKAKSHSKEFVFCSFNHSKIMILSLIDFDGVFFRIVENGSPDPWGHHMANARPPPSNIPPSYTSLPAELVSDFSFGKFCE